MAATLAAVLLCWLVPAVLFFLKQTTARSTPLASKHEAVYVTVTVPDDRMAQFLEVMKVDCLESRKEEGCTRFDGSRTGRTRTSFTSTKCT